MTRVITFLTICTVLAAAAYPAFYAYASLA